jgi:uncharacterized protein YoxC
MPDLSTTNMWLAILAVANVIQVLMLIVAAVVVSRALAKANAAVEAVQSQVRPLAIQTSVLLEDLRDVAGRVRRVDDEMHAAVQRANDRLTKATTTLGHASRIISDRAWPALGLVRAAQAVVSSMRTRSRRQRDKDAEARFVYEGAPVDVRS